MSTTAEQVRSSYRNETPAQTLARLVAMANGRYAGTPIQMPQMVRQTSRPEQPFSWFEKPSAPASYPTAVGRCAVPTMVERPAAPKLEKPDAPTEMPTQNGLHQFEPDPRPFELSDHEVVSHRRQPERHWLRRALIIGATALAPAVMLASRLL